MKPDLKSQMQLFARAQWWMALGLLALIMLVGILLLRPASTQLAQLDGRIASQQHELQIARQRLDQMSMVELQTEKLRLRVEYFDKRIPRHQDLPQLISDVTQIGRQVALGKLAWRPEASVRRTENFTELPLEFTFQGDFLSTLSFLAKVEDLPRLTRLQKLDVQAKDGSDGQVDVQLTMNIYFAEE